MDRWSKNGRAFSELLIEVFRVNGLLLEAGNEIARPAGLTSARWQVLGVVEHEPSPVAHIGRMMGLTRQNVQQIADALAQDGFIEYRENPHHRRAKLLCVTEKGRQAMALISERQVEWSNRIGAAVDPDDLSAAHATLVRLRETLEREAGEVTPLRSFSAMTMLPPSLSASERTDILALGERIEAHVAEQWESLLEENAEVLQIAYERSGDAAYGVFLGLLYRPIRILMEHANLRANPHFPGDFEASREWGNEDETDNQRWMWTTIETTDGTALGTIVTQIYHDHQGFRIPRAPGVLALRETGKAEVEAELSRRSADFAAATEFSVWYAEYLKSQGESA